MSKQFDAKIDQLDLSLFESIPTQSCDGDRLAWLAIQRSLRQAGRYTYLEIGSHLGGSLQQHIVDQRCKCIVSVDRRPLSMPDDRGMVVEFEGNSTHRMRANLAKLAPEQMDKLICFDCDARDVPLDQVPSKADFCLIDGEHTYAAVCRISIFAFAPALPTL